ncbi:MAG: transporter substrate-binding domain-containing protein [Pseudomonadota bacterium]
MAKHRKGAEITWMGRAFLGLCTAVWAVTGPLPGAAQTQVADRVTTAVAAAPPFGPRQSNATVPSFSLDLARALGARIGFEIDVVDTLAAQEIVQARSDGRIQMIAGIARLPALENTHVFSDPVASEALRLAVLYENAKAIADAPKAGLRIGIVPPVIDAPVAAFLADNEAVPLSGADAALLELLVGRVDALLLPNSVITSLARQAQIDDRVTFIDPPIARLDRFVALHDSRADLLPAVNSAIAAMENDGRLQTLRDRHFIEVPPVPGEVVVGVFDFKPYQFIDEDGAAGGFAIDVLRDLAGSLGLSLRFVAITRTEALRGPGPGRYDVLPHSAVTPARSAQMDFTAPILISTTSLFVRADRSGLVGDLSDLEGRRLGVQPGSIGARLLESTQGIDVEVFPDRDEMLAALLAGRLDAVVYDAHAFEALARDRDAYEQIARVRPPLTALEAAPALRFGLGPLRAELNGALPSYMISERFAALNARYFGPEQFWTQARIWIAIAVMAFVGLLTMCGAAVLVIWSRAQRRAAKEISVVRDELQTIFNAASSGIVALDRAGQIVRINDRARHMLGGTCEPVPFVWPPEIDFWDAETRQPIDAGTDPVRRALSGRSLRGETHLMRRLQPGEDRRYVRVDNARVRNAQSAIHTVMVIDDVSNEERNRQVVDRKNRLDALGLLTGGIAHDFNNLLASMLYAVDLAGKAADDARRARYLEIATAAIHRGRSLTSRLLSFARRQPGLATVRKASDVFDEFKRLVRPMLEAQIDITWDLEEPDLWLYCDQAQLETALMNVVLNSRDAILRDGVGNRIEMRARSIRAGSVDMETRQHGRDTGDDGCPGTYRYVEISVSDNGPGMDEQTLARSTDPFFTTKDINSGTGLGLAMVYGFARNADGDLRIYSEPGIGTTVHLILPRGTSEGTREDRMPEDVVEHGSGETILVVEDESQLLAMITEVLEGLGYKVLAASSGQEALSLAEDRPDIDVLLTDVVMPGELGGFELARRVRALRPDVPVIYMSGYTGFTASEMGAVQAPLLQKPTPATVLLETIRRVLP